MRILNTPHGELSLPMFLPDATRGVVRTLSSEDLETSGVEALMVNILHLTSHPGVSVARSFGGLHRFMSWFHPIVSDSGGFQLFSLIDANPKNGTISSRGFSYRLGREQRNRRLTPTGCIQRQRQIGADILYCLDHCTHPDQTPEDQKKSVENTIRWARQCRAEFDRIEEEQERDSPPLLFAVVQGGNDMSLRRQCAEELQSIGFDGYGFGGWPIDDQGRLSEMVASTAELLPPGAVKHGLGVGKPGNMVDAFRSGYSLFDCVIPTRDARHRRLYVFNESPETLVFSGDNWYSCLYIGDRKHIKEQAPLDLSCDCLCCRTYSRAYLHHLFRISDPAALRLATIHNVRFYTRLIDRLRLETGRGVGTSKRT